jgi:hypothetical protein
VRDSDPRPTPADELSDWIQDPTEEHVGRSPRARTRLEDWLSEPAPARATALEDWLQGPAEDYAEQEAEDAWSTGESVSGASSGGHGERRPEDERPGRGDDRGEQAQHAQPAEAKKTQNSPTQTFTSKHPSYTTHPPTNKTFIH